MGRCRLATKWIPTLVFVLCLWMPFLAGRLPAAEQPTQLGVALIYDSSDSTQAQFKKDCFNDFSLFRQYSNLDQSALPIYDIDFSDPNWRRFSSHYFPGISKGQLPTLLLISVQNQKPNSILDTWSNVGDPYQSIQEVFKKVQELTGDDQVVTDLSSRVEIATKPRGADVSFDGANLGNAPASLAVEPGAHELKVSKERFYGYDGQIDVKPLTETKITVSLVPFSGKIFLQVIGQSSITQTTPIVGGQHSVPFPHDQIMQAITDDLKSNGVAQVTDDVGAPYFLGLSCQADQSQVSCSLSFASNGQDVVSGNNSESMPDTQCDTWACAGADPQGVMKDCAFNLYKQYADQIKGTVRDAEASSTDSRGQADVEEDPLSQKQEQQGNPQPTQSTTPAGQNVEQNKLSPGTARIISLEQIPSGQQIYLQLCLLVPSGKIVSIGRNFSGTLPSLAEGEIVHYSTLSDGSGVSVADASRATFELGFDHVACGGRP